MKDLDQQVVLKDPGKNVALDTNYDIFEDKFDFERFPNGSSTKPHFYCCPLSPSIISDLSIDVGIKDRGNPFGRKPSLTRGHSTRFTSFRMPRCRCQIQRKLSQKVPLIRCRGLNGKWKHSTGKHIPQSKNMLN
ncbi:uncharacterized protein LOC111518525 [Drosophila willistoni]|uniref:uncharacterized protein LOC111518525 n=1 Tax=Drosophila willistoni TaxID=7260 RepID=UPI000C26D523|nr:uncharacterized protein LOC111518525 [Drosophila willistoni]